MSFVVPSAKHLEENQLNYRIFSVLLGGISSDRFPVFPRDTVTLNYNNNNNSTTITFIVVSS